MDSRRRTRTGGGTQKGRQSKTKPGTWPEGSGLMPGMGSHRRFAAEGGLVPLVLEGLLWLLWRGHVRAIELVQYEFHEGDCNRDREIRKK